MSSEEYFIALIYGLYLIRCIKIIDNNSSILLTYDYKKIIISFPIKYSQVTGQSFAFLNLFKFYAPIYKIDSKTQEYKNKILIKKIKAYSIKLKKILPIVIVIWIISFILLPLSLYFMHELILISLSIALYTFILILCIVLWKDKKKFRITKRQCISLSLDYLLCPPFAANTIRDLSINYNTN